MSAFLDDLIVGAALLVSLGYAVAKLGPAPWRKRILATLSQVFKSAPATFRVGGIARRLDAASGKNQSACGGCDNCGAESAAPQSTGDVSVPISKIGRRA